MDTLQRAIELLRNGAKRVELDWDGCEVVAYWVGAVLRIDIKGLR